MGRGMLNRANLRLLLIGSALIFTLAAAVAIYRLTAEREALFDGSRAGRMAMTRVVLDNARMMQLATRFRDEPSSPNLEALHDQFAHFQQQVDQLQHLAMTGDLTDEPGVVPATSSLAAAMPRLGGAVRVAELGRGGTIETLLDEMDLLDEPVAVLIANSDPSDKVLASLDITNLVLGVALITGFILIALGLIQLQRATQLYDQNVRTRAQLETRIGAIEATRDGIALVGPDGSVEFANQSLVTLLGILSVDIILGRFWSEVPAIGKVPLVAADGGPLNGSAGGKATSTEIAIARGNKDTRYWDLSITPRVDGGSVVLVRDITERRLAQRQNELLREQFLRSQKMEAVGRLTGGIAHDFNNILAAVAGFAHLLRDDLATMPEQAGFARQILSAAERGKELVRRMLSFSRADMERQSIVDLQQIAAETTQMLSSALPQRGRFYSAVPPVLPPVFGNATQVAQVIMNLVLNASDATEETKGIVTLEFRVSAIDGGCAQGLITELAQQPTDNAIRVVQVDETTCKAWIGILSPPGDYVHIRVADTGSGIPFNIMERMFDPFFTTKGQGKGTGLGLASVIGIVKSHRGAIAVESQIGVGSEFHIFLPVADSPARAAEVAMAENPSLVLSGIRVLIVDDDIAVGTVLQKMFDRFDSDATLCADPVVARESIVEDPSAFDLIVTDMTMPDINGIDLAAACRRAGFAGTLILVTGRAETVSEPLLRSAGINGLLSKPFSQEDVAREVRAALGHDATSALQDLSVQERASHSEGH